MQNPRPITPGRSDIGTVLDDKFELVAELGSGGMGVVYKARHVTLSKFYAIKVLNSQLNSDLDFRARFDKEAKTASLLNHPNLVSIHDYGMTPHGEAYLLMDFINGRGLDEELKSTGRLEQRRAAKIFMQICDGLEHAHSLGIVHRDLKPSNVMLIESSDRKDFARVVDFGIAKTFEADVTGKQGLTKTGQILGSPLYMSPEQSTGEPLTLQTDIYSLGVLMYQCLAGSPPFRGENALATITMHNESPPRPFDKALGINPELEATVMKALAKKPADRFASMKEMKRAMRHIFEEDSSGSLTGDDAASRGTKAARTAKIGKTGRSPAVFRLKPFLPGLAAGILLLAGLLFCFYARKSAAPPVVQQAMSGTSASPPVVQQAMSGTSASPPVVQQAMSGTSASPPVVQQAMSGTSAWPPANENPSPAGPKPAAEAQSKIPPPEENPHLPVIPPGFELPEVARQFSAERLVSEGAKHRATAFKGKTPDYMAVRYFVAALEKDPSISTAYEGMGGFYWDLYDHSKAPDVRKKALKDALLCYTAEGIALPNNSEAFRLKTNIEETLGKRLDALNDIQKAIDIKPEDASLHLAHANILVEFGKKPEALVEMEKYLTPADAGYMWRYGSCYSDCHTPQETITNTTKWINKTKNNPGLLLVRATAYKSLGNWEAALSDLRLLKKIDAKYLVDLDNEIKTCQDKLADSRH